MRILFLAHRLPYPPTKGDKIRSFWELRHLAAHHEVDLFCFYDDAADEEFLQPARKFCSNLYAEKLSWIRSRFQALMALLHGRAFTPAYFYSRAMSDRVKDALRSRNYDLVFVFSSSMVQYVPSGIKIPRILDMVDVDSDKWAQYEQEGRSAVPWVWKMEARRLAEVEWRAIDDFSATLVCTDAEAAVLQRDRSSSKVLVLENELNTDYFDPEKVEVPQDIADWQPYIIFTGTMDYLPNVDAATFFCSEVFPRLKKSVPNLNFVIAGRNPVRSIRRLSQDSSIHVTGTTADIRPYLKGALAAVAPLRIARGVQNKILEALAMGLPVATSRKAASALPSLLTAHLVVEDDPERLATALAQLCVPPVKRLPPEVRQILAERLSDPLLTERFEAIIRTVCLQPQPDMVANTAADVCATDRTLQGSMPAQGR
jgi:sugar transferase (PEP-CTERM/EpsH1 system associated)